MVQCTSKLAWLQVKRDFRSVCKRMLPTSYTRASSELSKYQNQEGDVFGDPAFMKLTDPTKPDCIPVWQWWDQNGVCPLP